MRVNNTLRNLLMKQSETQMIDECNCIYMGKPFRFHAVNKGEILKTIEHLRNLLKK